MGRLSVAFAAAAVLAGAQALQAAVVSLTFSGNYSDVSDVFGVNAASVPFVYTMKYDTSLNTNSSHLTAGVTVGGYVPTTDWYGYSRSGIVEANFTFGSRTFTVASLQSRMAPGGSDADFWFDTDIAAATPTLAWMYFDDFEGSLNVGGGAVQANELLLQAYSSVYDNMGMSSAYADTMAITSSVPEPGAIALLSSATGLLLLGRRRPVDAQV